MRRPASPTTVALALLLAGSGVLALASCTPAETGCGAACAPTPPRASRTPSPTSPATPDPGTLVDARFDDVPPGPVTPQSFVDQVGRTTEQASAYDAMTYVRNGDDRGGYVRTHLAAHRILAMNDQPADGNVLVVALPDQTRDSACVAYDVRFRSGFAFAAGGKLPGLLGVAPGVSPGTPTGGGSVAHGWSGRVMWHGPALWQDVRESGLSNLGETYLYHPGQAGRYGDDLGWGRGFGVGRWHRVRQCYRLNTVRGSVGRPDGTLRAWLDGARVLDLSDVVYRNDPAVHITHLDWSVFRGGDTLAWAAGTDGDVDLDNLLVTTG